MTEAKEDVEVDDERVDSELFISCRFCKKVFKSTEVFTKHYCKNLRKKQLYTCYVCKRHFSDLNVLSEHASHHPRKKFYKCYFCKRDFKNLTEQRNHIMLHKLSYSNEVLSDKFHLINLNKNDDSKVDEKNQTISSIKGNQFVKDNQTISDKIEAYLCSICNVTFPNMSQLASHNCDEEKPDSNKHYSLRSNHSKKKKHCYLCNNCNKSCEQECYSKSYLGLCKHCQSLGFEIPIPKHTTKVHKSKSTDMKKILSTFDNKKLHSIATNESTKRSSTETKRSDPDDKRSDQSLRCNVCKNDFNDSINLKEHMTTHETKGSLFICVKCKQNFRDIDEFKRHEETHKKYSLKSYSCKICKRPYKTLHALIEHMRTHPEYSFTCGNCHQMFTTLMKYEKHKTICDRENIDDVTDYTCDVCNVSFTNEVELEKHLTECEKFLDQFETVKKFVATQEACKNCGEHLREDSEENQMFTELMNDLFTCDDCLETPEEKIVSCDNCLENIPDLFKNENQSKYEIRRKSPRMFEVKLASKNGKFGCVDETLKQNGNGLETKENINGKGVDSSICDDAKLIDVIKLKNNDTEPNTSDNGLNDGKSNIVDEKSSRGERKSSFGDKSGIDDRKSNTDGQCDNQQNVTDVKHNIVDAQSTIIDVHPDIVNVNPNVVDVKPNIKPNIVDLYPNIIDVKTNIETVKPNIVDIQPSIVNVIPNIVDTQPSIVTVIPNIVDVKPNIVDIQPNIVDTQPSIVTVIPNIVDVKPNVVTVNPGTIDVKPDIIDDQNITKPSIAPKRIVNKKSLIDFVNEGGDESQISDDKNVDTLKQAELLDLLDDIDFNPETDVNDMSNFEMKDVPSMEPNEMFVCDVCGEKFDYINDLDVHKYIHSDKKSFICADCRNGFLDLFQLESHKCDTKK